MQSLRYLTFRRAIRMAGKVIAKPDSCRRKIILSRRAPPRRPLKRKMPALNALKAFEVAGRTGSFTRAAELLNVTQSAVSRQVRQLEIQLGEPLLQRQHHHLELSASGRLLLRALQQSFD